MTEAIQSILTELKAQRENIKEATKSTYDRAIELFKDYKEKTVHWKIETCKALEEGNNAMMYIAAKKEERDEILEQLIDN